MQTANYKVNTPSLYKLQFREFAKKTDKKTDKSQKEKDEIKS